VRCVEEVHPRRRAAAAAALALLAACGGPLPPSAGEAETPRVAAANASAQTDLAVARAPSGRASRATAAAALPPPQTMRSWPEVRIQAAQRLIAAHPESSYLGTPPLTLLAIPVLEVELNGDGSIRHIVVLRHPGQAGDTTQLAIDALRRAAPYGNVSRLPRPWKFVETFLFDDDRRFKPRSLD